MAATIRQLKSPNAQLVELWNKRSAGLAEIPVPTEFQQKRRYFATVTDVRSADAGSQDPEGTIRAVISTNEIDLYGTIIEPLGAVLDSYQRNPVLLWAHGSDASIGTMPIGEVPRLYVNQNSIEASVRFYDDEPGRTIGERYAKKRCRGFSIGFVPIAIKVEQVGDQEVVRFVKWRLVELSAVSIPANGSALARTGQDVIDCFFADCEEVLAGGGDVAEYVVRSLGDVDVSAVPGVAPPAEPAAVVGVADNPAVIRTVADTAATPPAEERSVIQVELEVGDADPQTLLSGLAALMDGLAVSPEDEAAADAEAAGEAESNQAPAATVPTDADEHRVLVDWAGNFSVDAECRGADPEALPLMAGLSVGVGASVVRLWVHHRAADGAISWPALAASMADLIGRSHDLTPEQIGAGYDHLAAHYRELGIEPPEARPHTAGEAYDLALAGRVALLEGDQEFMFARAQTIDGVAVPIFRNIATGAEVAFAPPGEGRFTDATLWGQRQLPQKPVGLESVLERLARAQEQLLENQEQRAGAEFSRRNKARIVSLAASLETIGRSLLAIRRQCVDTAGELRNLVQASESDSNRSANGDAQGGRVSGTGGEEPVVVAGRTMLPGRSPDPNVQAQVRARRARVIGSVGAVVGHVPESLQG